MTVEQSEPQPPVAGAGLFDLRDRVAVVTGASSGIGARAAMVLAGAGATVYAAARRQDRLDSMAAEVPGIRPVRCDVAKSEDRDALMARVLSESGGVDVLVNSAGVGGVGPAESEDLGRAREVIEVNLLAALHLSQLAVGSMSDRGGGAIVHVGSILGLVAGTPMSTASYAASKGGLVALTRETGAQWARRGVRVNLLAPGWIETEMTTLLRSDPSSVRWVRRNTPIGRFGRVEELDGAILFLCSDASRFCIGHVLVVDGGWTAR